MGEPTYQSRFMPLLQFDIPVQSFKAIAIFGGKPCDIIAIIINRWKSPDVCHMYQPYSGYQLYVPAMSLVMGKCHIFYAVGHIKYNCTVENYIKINYIFEFSNISNQIAGVLQNISSSIAIYLKQKYWNDFYVRIAYHTISLKLFKNKVNTSCSEV